MANTLSAMHTASPFPPTVPFPKGNSISLVKDFREIVSSISDIVESNNVTAIRLAQIEHDGNLAIKLIHAAIQAEINESKIKTESRNLMIEENFVLISMLVEDENIPSEEKKELVRTYFKEKQ